MWLNYDYIFLPKANITIDFYLNSLAGGANLSNFCNLCSKTKCRLLATHDDYSMMSKLPREKTSVVTVLRNPIDRVFSTYEFSVEVAARFLVHPNLTSATEMTKRIRAKNKGVSTLDIWPWKYLVPWMREDLFTRVCLSCIFLLDVLKSISSLFFFLDYHIPHRMHKDLFYPYT